MGVSVLSPPPSLSLSDDLTGTSHCKGTGRGRRHCKVMVVRVVVRMLINERVEIFRCVSFLTISHVHVLYVLRLYEKEIRLAIVHFVR